MLLLLLLQSQPQFLHKLIGVVVLLNHSLAVPYEVVFGIVSCFGFTSQYSSIFYLQLDPFYASIILFVGRAWDAVTDPTVGFLVSRSRWTSIGRMMPWQVSESHSGTLCQDGFTKQRGYQANNKEILKLSGWDDERGEKCEANVLTQTSSCHVISNHSNRVEVATERQRGKIERIQFVLNSAHVIDLQV